MNDDCLSEAHEEAESDSDPSDSSTYDIVMEFSSNLNLPASTSKQKSRNGARAVENVDCLTGEVRRSFKE